MNLGALAAAGALIAAIYWAVALFAAVRLWVQPPTVPTNFPPVSILKPIHGRDERLYEAVRSHAELDYPEFEILAGVSDANDPALADLERLRIEYPGRAIRVIIASTRTPNGKVGVLADLCARARYPLLLVNDSDITVEPDYLRAIVARLTGPAIGLVTCLYRASADHWPAQWEALGIATDFAPSVLVARAIGLRGFALGSTMLFRAEHLERIGGFAAIGDFLADDYQLGQRIANLGLRVVLSKTVVETHLSGSTWSEVWRHQLRWARTIRVSRPGGYYGYIVTNASLWCLLAALAGYWRIGLAALMLRLIAGAITGAGVLKDRRTSPYWLLIPFRDLWGFAVWIAGLFGSHVQWRGQTLRLTRDGRIL